MPTARRERELRDFRVVVRQTAYANISLARMNNRRPACPNKNQ